MKRRTFLLALGGGLAAAWWLKPGDQGGPHGAASVAQLLAP